MCYWIVLGGFGLASCFRYGFDSHSPFGWIAVSVIILLVVLGPFALFGNPWAYTAMILPIGLVCLYAADCCYCDLFHGRFPKESWLRVADMLIGGLTLVATPVVFMRQGNGRPPVIR